MLLLFEIPAQAAVGKGAVGQFVPSHVLVSLERLQLGEQMW